MLRKFGPGDTRGHDIRLSQPSYFIQNVIWGIFRDGLSQNGGHAPKEVHLYCVLLAARFRVSRPDEITIAINHCGGPRQDLRKRRVAPE
jgi:hypothetical protein